MQNIILRFTILLGLYVSAYETLFAQKTERIFKGVRNGDIPTLLTIKPTKTANQYILTFKSLGQEGFEETYTVEYTDNYDKSRKRYYFYNEVEGIGLYLYDISKDFEKPEQHILSGYLFGTHIDYEASKMVFFLEK